MYQSSISIMSYEVVSSSLVTQVLKSYLLQRALTIKQSSNSNFIFDLYRTLFF